MNICVYSRFVGNLQNYVSRCAPSANTIRNRWRQPVPPAKAREPYDNEVVKFWTAEITKTTDIFKRLTQRDLSLTGGCDPHV